MPDSVTVEALPGEVYSLGRGGSNAMTLRFVQVTAIASLNKIS
jgi:hypothetical protein